MKAINIDNTDHNKLKKQYNLIMNGLIKEHHILEESAVCSQCSQDRDWLIFTQQYTCSSKNG